MKNALDPNALPDFATKQGEGLRLGLSTVTDFCQIIDRSSLDLRYDWQDWAVRTGLSRFPHDDGLVARALSVAVGRRDRVGTRSLRAVLASLPFKNRDVALDILARADFLLGDLDRGAQRLARLRQEFPEHDLNLVLGAQLQAFLDQSHLDQALALAASMQPHPKTLVLRIETFLRCNSYGGIIDLIDQGGGLDAVEDAGLAATYLSALEAVGALEQAITVALAYLERRPQSPPVAHMLRILAIRLDRLAEMLPALNRAAYSLAGQSEGNILLALIAMDRDDYALARKILALQDGPADPETLLNLAVSDPNVSRRQARLAYRAARKAGPKHAGPEMQYASYLMNEARRPADLREALRVTQTGLPWAQGNPYFHRLYLSVLVANHKSAEAKAHFESLPPALQHSQRLREVPIYFDHLAGADAAAKQAWFEQAKTAGYRIYGAQTTEASQVKEVPVSGPVIAFSVVYNGMDYLVAYFDHYRALGITTFVFVDNASNDGTREYLALQPDVILYEHAGSFRAAAHGVAWINPLIQRYARGKWALFVDVDEHLVFPLLDHGRTIADLVDYAQSKGANSFPSFMLDMFATPRSAQFGFAGHCYFDPQYLRYPALSHPYITVQGGVRGRMTHRHFLITKSPLVRVDADVHFTENNHQHSYLSTSKVTTALLHYKFVGDTAQKFTEAVTRGEHFMGGRFYRDMLARIRGQGIRAGLWARRYRGDAQLQHLGLLQSAPDWQNWKRHDG